jgi:tetratricopeptide (TPR) repeat protein
MPIASAAAAPTGPRVRRAGRLGALASLCLALFLSGCASDRMIEARAAYSVGNYQQAHALVSKLVEKKRKNRHLYQLELGVCDLAIDQPDAALTSWRAGRDGLDERAGRGLGESVAGWLADDNALDYEGTAYERVLVRAMLALAEMVAPGRTFGDDVIAYANQVIEEHIKITSELTQKRDDLDGRALAEDSFKLVSFGAYLVAMLRESDPLNVDEARFQMQKVVDLEPDRPWLVDELRRLEQGPTTTPGKGVVHVFGLVGRGPYRVEKQVPGTAEAFALAGVIVAITNRSLPQISLDGVPIAALAYHSDNPDALAVDVDGGEAGVTKTVTDVEEVARQEDLSTFDYRVARAIIRRAFKFAAVEGARAGVRAAKKGSDEQKTAAAVADIALAIGGSIWQAAEQADLRCWSLLPARMQGLRLELDPGVHDLTLRPTSRGRVVGPPTTIRVEVDPRRPAYVVALAPTATAPVTALSRQEIGVAEPDAERAGIDM